MNIQKIAKEIENRGFAVVKSPPEIVQIVEQLEQKLSEFNSHDMKEFSFPDVIDGFLPFGLEHAEGNPDHPDLCERFCYWRSRRVEHERYAISKSSFYKDIERFEQYCANQGTQILHVLAENFTAPTIKLNPNYSYIQLGIYAPRHSSLKKERQFLMDPHVDGQLLTFIVNTAEGLVVEENGCFVAPELGSNRMLIMAGKLLEHLSDGRIKGVNHAVTENEKSQRLSLIYFQNPDFSNTSQTSWVDRHDLNFMEIANEIHAKFGNPAYEATSP